MGMTDRADPAGKVEIPVALPLIMLGLRTGAIFVVATATIAAEIGLGGLGRYIIDGLATRQLRRGGRRRRCWSSSLALLVQVVFVGLRYLVVPAPLRAQSPGQLITCFPDLNMEGILIRDSLPWICCA